jgi:hypothetical protein
MCSGKERPMEGEPQSHCRSVQCNAGTLRLHLNEVLCQFRPAYRTPTLGTRQVDADCAGYDGDETPDHDRNKHTANAPGKLCHDERGDLDKDVEQHPRRIRTRREDAILFILKRSLAGPSRGYLKNNRPSAQSRPATVRLRQRAESGQLRARTSAPLRLP